MPGTDHAYGGTRELLRTIVRGQIFRLPTCLLCDAPLLTNRMALAGLSACYAMPGTNTAYGTSMKWYLKVLDGPAGSNFRYLPTHVLSDAPYCHCLCCHARSGTGAGQLYRDIRPSVSSVT
eukprot:3880082-Rhodomonas_salina.2